MMSTPQQLIQRSDQAVTTTAETVQFLRERITRAPRVAMVLGSGLGALADALEDPVTIPYHEIPGFGTTTVVGHDGALIAGILEGVEVAILRGRFHLYEGWPLDTVAAPIRALAALGADTLVVTNAAGGIRKGLRPGDLMMLDDHINFMFRNPLIGGVVQGEQRFPDMSDPYDRSLQEVTSALALELGISLQTGVYAAVLGPSYETPAEIQMLSRLGADAVGMSTVPEVVTAKALGLRVVGISCITNLAAGLGQEKLGHEEVLEVGKQCSDRLIRLISGLLPRIASLNYASEAAQ